MLYRMEELQEIIETCFFTSRLKEHVPVSLLLVAPSGTGKSALIKQYSSDNFFVTDSFSSEGLWNMMQMDRDNRIKFLVVPDMNPTLSRKPSTVQAAVANLLSLTFDGTTHINDGRGNKECKHLPIGFLSGVTPEIYNQHARRWLWLGLRRRIIPIFFDATPETVAFLNKMVREEKINNKIEGRKITLPADTYRVNVNHTNSLLLQSSSQTFAHLLGKFSVKDSERKLRWIDSKIMMVAPHIIIRSLACAHARMKRRGAVVEDDINFVNRFLAYVNPEAPRFI